MGEIREYKCTYSNSVGISAEVTSGLGLEFPDAYMHSETMQILARAIKEHDEADFCLLPFCRTVEAEAMGAVLNYGVLAMTANAFKEDEQAEALKMCLLFLT